MRRNQVIHLKLNINTLSYLELIDIVLQYFQQLIEHMNLTYEDYTIHKNWLNQVLALVQQ